MCVYALTQTHTHSQSPEDIKEEDRTKFGTWEANLIKLVFSLLLSPCRLHELHQFTFDLLIKSHMVSGLSRNDGRDHLCASAQDPFRESQAYLFSHSVKLWSPHFLTPPHSLFQISSACFNSALLLCSLGNLLYLCTVCHEDVLEFYLSWAFFSLFLLFSISPYLDSPMVIL